jgi:hypothetical protein
MQAMLVFIGLFIKMYNTNSCKPQKKNANFVLWLK